jgi:uncharacterized membrane protein
MKRKGILWAILATIALAIVVHIVTLTVLPYMIMNATMAKYETNVLTTTGQPTSASRNVVRPAPDLYSSRTAYDLSKGPIKFTAKVPTDNYWSVSFYANNTDNFLVINDKQVKSNPLQILLVTQGMKYSNPDNAQVVISPSTKGIMLVRQLVPSPDKLADVADIAKQAFLTVVSTP